MNKYLYTYFGDAVPRNVEKEYNRLRRKEQYLEEQDKAHGIALAEDAEIFEQYPDRSGDWYKTDGDILQEERLKYLPIALELLRLNYPEEYALIHDYYFSEENMTLVYLAKRYKMSRQVAAYKFSKAISLLKNYIISHENGK